MPRGRDFNLTDKRIEKIRKLFAKQHSLRYVANKLGIGHDHLGTKLKAAGLDVRQMKLEGISTMKADMFASLQDVEEPEKKVKLALDILKQYDTTDEVAQQAVNIQANF